MILLQILPFYNKNNKILKKKKNIYNFLTKFLVFNETLKDNFHKMFNGILFCYSLG